MGLYDDIFEEQQKVVSNSNIKKTSTGLYDDLFVEEQQPIQQAEQPQTFREAHPFVSSLPEAGKQLGLRSVKSYPEFAKGLGDLTALIGDTTNLKGLSNFGKSNADFWQRQADKINIDPRYQGLNGLKSKETFIPTVLGEVGGQATNIAMALGGGAAAGTAAKAAGLKTVGQAVAITAGSALPNLAQEGQYLEKIENFKKIYGREPNESELQNIQKVALGEKGINTALETVADRLLFGKLFPKGGATKGLINKTKKVGKDILEQTITEAGTEGLQESVSVGAEKMLGINEGTLQDNLSRIGEAVALGGLTGGAIGGASSVAARDYDTQFPDNNTNPIQAAKEVSAKIISNGKELYNSANEPSAFEVMQELSKQGTFSNNKRLQELAPNTMQKLQEQINNSSDVGVQNTGLPNLVTDNQNLYNVSENGENEVVSQADVENIAKELQETVAPTENTSAVLERPQEIEVQQPEQTEQTTEQNLQENLQQRKETAKNGVIDRIKELAPNTAQKIENTNSKIVTGLDENGNPQKYDVSDINNIKEVNSSTSNIENIAPKTSEKIKANNNSKYSYNEKYSEYDGNVIELSNKKGENLGYISYSTEDNEVNIDYVKSNNIEKGISDKLVSKLIEKYPDKTIIWDCVTEESEKARKSFIKKHPEFKDKIKGLWYNEAKAQFKKDEELAQKRKNAYNSTKGVDSDAASDNNRFNEEVFQGTGQNLSDDISKGKRNNENTTENDGSRSKSSSSNATNGRRKTSSASNEIEKIAPNTFNKINSDIDIPKLKQDIIDLGFNAEEVNELIDKMVNNEPFGDIKMYRFGVTIGQRLYQNKKHQDYEKLKKRYLENLKKQNVKNSSELGSNINKKDIDNGLIQETNGNGPRISEKQEEESGRTSGISQETSAHDEHSDGIGRTNELSNGVNSEQQENVSNRNISKRYKNQFELNSDIESFINNKEYEKYSSLPDDIKSWLKKYTGAGGLEKQGAEGKGLLSEYYTPHNVVKKMWELTAQYINTDGAKVLEPSVGIGRFLENAPENTKFDVVEMNPVSAKITELLYPEANVTNAEFQERFINKANNTSVKSVTPEYDIVIGNPPYGIYSGRFKGLGEGKNIARLEHYFIKRGLDTLKENGIMTFIVPSSFLDGAITKVKQDIGAEAELLDAYRLPENLFDTTSIGTDIIVLRKKRLSGNPSLLNAGNWFKQNPDKILGTVETRKNRFGKEETYVKGDKSAVENIDTSEKKDVQQTKETTPKQKTVNSVVRKNRTVAEKTSETQKGNVVYDEYIPDNVVSEDEMKLFNDTQVDGTLPKNKYKANEKISQYNGELYNDFNYLQGDIYEKLDALEDENISEKQKEIQKAKLLKVLPKEKLVNEISFNPTSDFIREFKTDVVEEVEVWDYNTRKSSKKFQNVPLDKMYLKYADKLTRAERDDVPVSYIRDFVHGNKIRLDYNYPSGMYDDKERETYRKQKSAEMLSKIKNVVDKTFNEFVRNELDPKEKEKLVSSWNRNFNAVYNPDYKSMPMIVKGLNSQFFGKKLELQNVQVEGVNFLTNKGVGLLGFEVGVGKTLTGIISTVQNMQMGRCKKPLILVPKQVKSNWINEIHQAFPNIKVNDVDNLSKFKGEIPENTLTVATYEALGNIWYGDLSNDKLTNILYEVSQDLSQFDDSIDNNRRDRTKRAKETVRERAAKLVGLAEKGNKKLFNIQDLGFDHITVDEAHNFKNLFADAKADGQEGNAYTNITGGTTSSRATRLFLFTQYILNNNNNRNVFMLTATPFNNSPLEVFNMLSFIAKDKLDKMGLYNVYQFMENYADISSDWIVNSRNEVEYKQIVTAFKNATSLRELIKSVMLIRSAEDAGIVRPEKFTKRVILEPSEKQIEQIKKAEEEAVKGGKDDGAVLKAINQSRKATLSPDIAADNFDVSPEDLINNSPKLSYIVSAVESMKKKDPTTSQLIYMPLGVRYLPKIKEYMVNKGIFKQDEVEIIESGVSDDKIDKITESFNDRNGKVKLIIGTNKIKEGMNLNKNSSVLYVPYMDWNPTDFVQIVGRIWRRGNRYSKIRVVVPLLKNSSDSFMFQKLNEKTDRINNIMDESKEYINTSELNTAEEKINMISNPDKKVQMFIRVEKQKLEAQKSSLEGRLEMVRSYKQELTSNENMIQYSKDRVAETEKSLKEIDPEKSEWNYNWTKDRLSQYKKDVSTYTYALKKTKERIARLELDFNGKDSDEAITSEIEKLDEQIKNVEKLSETKLAEYTKQYEEERKNSKTIKELVAEFEKDTYELYPEENSKSEDSKPLGIEPKKKYERTREQAYSVPVIKLETEAQKRRKEKKASVMQKAKTIGSAKQYDKLLKDGIAKWSSEINIRRYEADRTLNAFINITKTIAKQMNVNDRHLREVMPFLRERTEFPEELNRPELKAVWEKLNKSASLKENVTKLADNLSDKFEKFWNEYKAVQASGDFETNDSEVKNYITHIWDLDQKKQGLLTTYFATKSRFAKQRKIDTLYNGINGITLENGETLKLKPKVLDYAEILKIQSDNLIKATVDKVFADSVKSLKTADGVSLVLPANKAPMDWVEINNSALNKTVAKPVSTSFGEKISPVLINKLAEMGIAIGNRLSKYKANGLPNSLGKYVKNEPPEIRLQKWFSTKTLAHEVGHAMDEILGLSKDGFVDRYKDELLELNKERIEAFEKQGDRKYAEKDSELIAELFGVMFNDVESALKYAPAATSEIMDKMTKNKQLEQLLPNNFDWSEAKHVIEEKVVEFFKMPVKVHPDIASTLKTVFENKKEYLDVLGFKPGKTFDDVNAIAKMFNFSLSGFHGWALSESYLGNVGVKGLKDTFNFKKIYDSVKNNEYDIYKKSDVAEQAIMDGLQIGATLDVQRNVAEGLIHDVGTFLEKHIPGFGKPISMPVKVVEKGTELNNKVLWDVIHNNYKLNAYEILMQNESKNGVMSDAKRREIAQWVNDSFGGLAWENLGISPSTKKSFSRWLMSPDWLLATTRQFLGGFSSKAGHKALNSLAAKSEFWSKVKDTTQFFGITSLTDDIEASGMRGRIARRFWVRAAIQSVIYMNLLNALFRAWDRKEHEELYPKQMKPVDFSMLGNSKGSKSYVFIGRNKDGSERYARFGKQFREMPEMIEDPIKHIGAKVAPIPQSISTIFTGRSMSGFENKEMTEASGIKRVGVAAKQLGQTFLPFSVGSLVRKGSDFSAFDLVATTGKGMTKYKAQQEFKNAFEHGNKPNVIQDIKRSMTMNGMSNKDINTIYNRAKGQYTKQFKDEYLNAIENKDNQRIVQINNKMSKNNFSKAEQREIYTKALKEFYKERKIAN